MVATAVVTISMEVATVSTAEVKEAVMAGATAVVMEEDMVVVEVAEEVEAVAAEEVMEEVVDLVLDSEAAADMDMENNISQCFYAM